MDIPTLALPGPFVVLQGMEGDGLSNTIDTMPYGHFHHGSHGGGGHHSEDGDSYSTATPPRSFRGSAHTHTPPPRRNRTYDEQSDDRSRGRSGGGDDHDGAPRSPVSEMDYDQEVGGENGEREGEEVDEEGDDDDLGGFHHVSRQQEPHPPPPPRRGVGTVSSSSENSSSRESIVILQHGDGGEDDGHGGGPNGVGGGGGAGAGTAGAAAGRAGSSPGSPPRARRRTHDGDGDGGGGDEHGPPAALSPREAREREREDASIRGWRRECREREVAQLTEVWQQWRGAGGPPRGRGRGDPASSCWWQRDGRLAVFASPTIHPTPAAGGVEGEEEDDDVEDVLLLGTLAPGSVVRGCELVPALPTFRSARQLVPPEGGRASNDGYTFLRIEAPLSGFVLYRGDHYLHLAPGPPTGYCDPGTWVWRVTCPDGAYVRTGLELNSSHLTTIPYGVLMKVTRKTVNAMGLSRLRISYAKNAQGDGPEGMRLRRTDSTGCDSTTVPQSNTAAGRNRDGGGGGDRSPPILMEGWISEALNPLSGQRGPIAQPLPFPIPALYRVTLPDGAVVRSDIELSSSEVRVAPFGSVIKVVGRAFSEHPMDQCIERLRLAGGGGWVSVRLNRPPPLDVLIVDLIGLDESFDPDDPGRYHLRAQEDHEEFLRPSSVGGSSVAEEGGPELPASSSYPPPGMGSAPSHGRGPSAVSRSTSSSRGYGRSSPSSRRGLAGGDARGYHSGTRGRSGRAGLERGKKAGGSSSRRKHFNKGEVNEEKCLICLTEERTATIVHGETGHIACCLTCARILRARGDKCPVCRLPIDLVIQHFWC